MSMPTFKAIDPADTSYLDSLLLDNGKPKSVSAMKLARVPQDHLTLWAQQNARYQIVTSELIDWLETLINGRRAIEVGAGMGDIGSLLGIPMTDSRMQERPEIRSYYDSMNVAITVPPPEVETLDAMEAVRKYNPQVVIASWLTQKYMIGDEETQTGSSVYGVDEFDIITHDSVEAYVHIGNKKLHGDKRSLKVAHAELSFPWLVSRGFEPHKNVIYLWGK